MILIQLWVNALTVNRSASFQRTRASTGQLPAIDTPPPSVDDSHSLATMSDAIEDEEPAPEYKSREYDWFTPGRLFEIFAPRDIEIHKKKFVLLDTKNKEGQGILIRNYANTEEDTNHGYFLRSHVLVQEHGHLHQRVSRAKLQVVYLDEYDDHSVAPETWIELEHTYNIPFATYKCIDHGVLDRASLKDLRTSYVAWLGYHWSLD